MLLDSNCATVDVFSNTFHVPCFNGGSTMFELKEGDIIEQYDDDFPFPSVLINGLGAGNVPLHVVVAINSDELKLVIITVYKPDPLKWIDQFSRRIK